MLNSVFSFSELRRPSKESFEAGLQRLLRAHSPRLPDTAEPRRSRSSKALARRSSKEGSGPPTLLEARRSSKLKESLSHESVGLLNMKKSNSFYGRKGGNTQYSKAYPTPQTYSTPQYSTPQTLSARIGEIPRDMPTESVEESPAESEVWDPATEACPAA